MINSIENIFSKYNLEERKDINDVKAEIQKIEDHTKNLLPDDYKFFLEKYSENEIDFGNHIIILWDLFDLVKRNSDYFVFESTANLFAIGSDGSGECIAMHYADITSKPTIVLAPFMDLEEENFIKIGVSFSDFIKRLEKGGDWFS